jgi:hypothetical protein
VRFLPVALLALALVGCGDDDDDRPGAAAVTTTTTTTIEAAEDCAGADPVAPSAADGTPAEVVATVGDLQLAVVDRGASVDVVSLFVTVDCAFEPVQLDGRAAALAVGGSVTHGDGLRCEGDDITVLSATSDDGATYQATATRYRVDGTELVEIDRQASTIEAQADPDELEAYYRLDC